MSSLEQDRGRADIRSERSHGWRSERSRGNMPVACLSEKATSLRAPRRIHDVYPALQEEIHSFSGRLCDFFGDSCSCSFRKGIKRIRNMPGNEARKLMPKNHP
jgi:hypothetical protein